MKWKRKSLVFILITTAILLCVAFVRKAHKAGRTLELIISLLALGGSYHLWWLLHSNLAWWTIFIPIGIFSTIWYFLFQHEKITSTQANPMWAQESWWWNLDGWEFEEEVAKVFRLNGYQAEVTQKTSDGGIDLLMHKDGETIIVQCKHYSNPVSVQVARELNGLKDDFKADKLILVASSGVTRSCREFLKNKPYFQVLDLDDIISKGLRPYSS